MEKEIEDINSKLEELNGGLLVIRELEGLIRESLGKSDEVSLLEKESFYELEELEQKLKLTKHTLRSFIHEGKLKAYRVGKNFRVSKKDLLEFLDESRV